MLTRLPGGSIEASIRPPLIYLDHWAVRAISSDEVRRQHLLETFRTRGTLMFSVPNILEMAKNTGESYAQIRGLLDAIEPYWLLSDPDPQTVQDREIRGLLPPESFLVPSDLLRMVFRGLPEGTFRLGSALDALQDQPFRERAASLLGRDDLVKDICRGRERYRRGESFMPIVFPEGSPLWIQVSLLRHLIADGKIVTRNDVTDMLHAVVPLRYAVVLLLDKAWANFATKLRLPDTQVFSPPSLDEALQAIRSVDVSKHRILRMLPSSSQ